MRRSKLVYILAFVAIMVGYLVVVLTLPPDVSVLTKYNLTPEQARALSLTVILPVILIYSLGLYGFLRIRDYSVQIRKDRDGKAFLILTKGLAVFVFGIPFHLFLTGLVNNITRTNEHLIPTGVILQNYFLIAVMLSSFYYMYKGARGLVKNMKHTPRSAHYYIWNMLFVILSVNFVFFTLSNPARRVAVEGVRQAVYYLPDWLIVNTIILPYLLSWYLGMLCVYYLRHYRNKVQGILYKKALTYISNGIGAVILASMLQRFLNSLTVFFSAQSLRVLLLIIFLLLVVISIGYVYIAIGAKRLRKIEEV